MQTPCWRCMSMLWLIPCSTHFRCLYTCFWPYRLNARNNVIQAATSSDTKFGLELSNMQASVSPSSGRNFVVGLSPNYNYLVFTIKLSESNSDPNGDHCIDCELGHYMGKGHC